MQISIQLWLFMFSLYIATYLFLSFLKILSDFIYNCYKEIEWKKLCKDMNRLREKEEEYKIKINPTLKTYS